MTLMPISFSYGAELTFPVHPGLVQGFMYASVSISSTIQLFIYNCINSTMQKKHGIITNTDSADFDEEAVMWI